MSISRVPKVSSYTSDHLTTTHFFHIFRVVSLSLPAGVALVRIRAKNDSIRSPGRDFKLSSGAKTLVISSMIHFHAFQLSKTCFECPIRRSHNSQSSPHGPTDRVGEPKGIKKKRPKSGRTHVVLPNHVV